MNKIILVFIAIIIISYISCSNEKINKKNSNLTIGNVNTNSEHEGHDHELEKDKIKTEIKEKEHEHINLSDEAIKIAGIKIDYVKLQKINKKIELLGEIGFDEDHYIKVVPRFSGIVTKVNKRLGDKVKEGEILAIIESNESLTKYSIKSSLSGRIIKKYITIGTYVSNEKTIYEIADLSKVWVDLVVYVKNSNDISIGQLVDIQTISSNMKIQGYISYISSFYNKNTRNLIARVVILNNKGLWYPGTYVKGIIHIVSEKKLPVISLNSIQIIDGRQVVFVPESKNVFILKSIVLGKKNKKIVHIKKGLKVGDLYVSKGSFDIKAKIITSDLGSHAGHGH